MFWRELATGFENAGAKTHHVNFSLGDRIYWWKRGARNFRKPLSDWADYVRELIIGENITDILYYADQLPYHRIAHEVAKDLGVRCHAVEYGYLRPDWVTLERGGMGRLSHFPNQPEQISAIARQVGPVDLVVRYAHSFWNEAANEVLYNLAAYFGRPVFPHYQSDKYYNPMYEYLMWLPRMLRRPKVMPDAYVGEGSPAHYLLALQLQSDYQIRTNSPYTHLSEMVEEVIRSFAAHAPDHTRLVVKEHPLDNGLERWEKVVMRIADEHGVGARVDFIDTGDIGKLMPKVSGVVVVNSTVGLNSISSGRPTIVLGSAIYNVEGLTHQAGLDSFWTDPAPVDPDLCDDYVRALAATVQVKGDFYNRAGRKVAIAEIVSRILSGTVNCPDAFVEVPPRMEGEHTPRLEA
ncbi:capsule biosynthesis protein [Hoeflea ulvae]|uniref:Capsular biosynthesis protein n=1 Tax=Hoeflea ulvae TaxID=2983764 RepID=A0ABT3YLA5_9HYPH|nr:capsular biosynthesis protein [Hoeflea ulvae]MCY0096377.1 capsular biosynthesis protein [Hoeflea ulvae]